MLESRAVKLPSYSSVCRPGSGAGAFFAGILVWGVGMGCFGALMALANSAFALTVPRLRAAAAADGPA